jgi:hypothetical protein
MFIFWNNGWQGVTKKGLGLGPTPEFFLAGTTRLELATSGVTGHRVFPTCPYSTIIKQIDN